MKNGKFGRKAKFSKRILAVLVSVTLICVVAIGATMAFLSAGTTGITNTFNPSQVTSLVVEDSFNGVKKSNVKIQNTGDIDAYIRADIVVTWMAENGNVLSEKPVAGVDYTAFTVSGWVEGSGYYYWPNVVAKDGFTGNLIEEVNALNTKTVGETTYYVSIEVLCSAIQSVPETTAENVWNVVIENGAIKAAN